jgi:hypothetical protein
MFFHSLKNVIDLTFGFTLIGVRDFARIDIITKIDI